MRDSIPQVMRPIGARALAVFSFTAISAVALPGASMLQDSPEEVAMLAIANEDALRRERESSLLEAYLTADEPARELAAAELREAYGQLSSRRNPLPLQALARAHRLLTHPDPDPQLAPWIEPVLAIDLRVTPGVFAARTEGRGEPQTVQVRSLWKSEVSGEVEARLFWRASDGAEILARREHIAGENLAAGFEMYIRPPISGPSAWRLILELRTPDDGSLRTQGIPVDCIARPDELLDALADEEQVATTLGLAVRRRLLTSRRDGYRLHGAVALQAWVEGLQGAGRSGAPVALVTPALITCGADVWQLGAKGKDGAREVYLLLADPTEHPSELLAGARGATWSRFAEEAGVRVLAAGFSAKQELRSALLALAVALKSELGVERLVVVARRDPGRLLPDALAGEDDLPIDALVLTETVAARAPLSPRLTLDTLQIESGAEQESRSAEQTAGGASRVRMRLREPFPLSLARVPGVVAAWRENR